MSLEALLLREDDTKAGILATPFFFQHAAIETFGWTSEEQYTDVGTLGDVTFSRAQGSSLVQLQMATLFTNVISLDELPLSLAAYRQRIQELFQVAERAKLRIDAAGSQHDFFRQPQGRVEDLRRVMKARTPVRLVVAHAEPLDPRAVVSGPQRISVPEMDMRCTLRSVAGEERMGEADARYVTLTFVEDVPLVVKTNAKGAGGQWKLAIRTLPKGRRTLAQLARHYYGDATKIDHIKRANQPWIAPFTRNDDLWALANAKTPPSGSRARLWKVLRKQKQIIVPKLTGSAASIRDAAYSTFVGEGL